MKNSFILYTDYIEHIEQLSDAQAGVLLKAIMKHERGEQVPEMDTATKIAFSFIRAQLDRDAEKYEQICEKRREAGKLGGRPKANGSFEKAKKANGFSEKQKKANESKQKQTKAKKPDTDNDTDNDTDYINNIVGFLNETCGTHYKVSSKKTRSLINARMKEGFTEDDFQTVIKKKAAEWIGTEQEKYLRPETLFGTKFEGYLNQRSTGRQQNRFNNFTQRDNDYEKIEAALIKKSMNGDRNGKAE